ncbi:Uncharacterized protein PBTT_05789 [Plasmodiophora brassicae]
MSPATIMPETQSYVVESAVDVKRLPVMGWKSTLLAGLRLFVVAVSAPIAIAVAFAGVDLAPATNSFESSQWPWVIFFTFLNTSWFVALPCAILNLFVDQPGCRCHFDFVMILCVFLNTLIALGIPYVFGVYPILFFPYLSSTILIVISRRISFIRMASGDGELHDDPSEDLPLPAKKALKLRAMAATTFNIHLLVVVACLVCFNLVPYNDVVVQAAAGFVTGTITIASRFMIPYVLFDRLQLDQIRQLHLDPNIRAYWTFYLEVNSEVYFNLAFPNIHSPIIFGVVVTIQMTSVILSSLWLFPQFADWMSASPNAQSPWSQFGIITKLGVKVLRPSSPMSIPSMSRWHDVARLAVFMRWLAKLTATVSFMTLYSLAFFTYNGRYLAFQAKDGEQYWRVMKMTLISLVCENVVLIGMSIARAFAFKNWNDPNNTSFFVRGGRLLATDSKALLFLFASMFTIMSISIAMFIQQANWLYILYQVR